LVADSGVAVYEGGTNLFNEPALVHLARPGAGLPEFEVTDHVGAVRGWSRAENVGDRARVAAICRDWQGNDVLRIDVDMARYGTVFIVNGVVGGQAETSWSNINELSLSAGREPIGAVVGPRGSGLMARSLTIVDHRREKVGAVKLWPTGRWFRRRYHYVVAADPGLRGELRRMLVGVPTMVDMVRRMEVG
jgi:hypothetical protein